MFRSDRASILYEGPMVLGKMSHINLSLHICQVEIFNGLVCTGQVSGSVVMYFTGSFLGVGYSTNVYSLV